MSETKPKPYVITFLRHGESVGNAESRWQGQSEFPLNDKGRAQAEALAERWLKDETKFDLIISSPLARARETAEIVGSALKVRVEADSIWVERDIGDYAGLTAAEVKQNHPQPDFVTPFDSVGGDGEGDWELFLRAGQALHGLLRRAPGHYLVVSHGGILNQVMYAVVGITPHANNSGPRFRFSNTAFSRVIYFPHLHRWAIDAVNDHEHWKEADPF
jgi:broad specificity phosphatase PhoE